MGRTFYSVTNEIFLSYFLFLWGMNLTVGMIPFTQKRIELLCLLKEGSFFRRRCKTKVYKPFSVIKKQAVKDALQPITENAQLFIMLPFYRKSVVNQTVFFIINPDWMCMIFKCDPNGLLFHIILHDLSPVTISPSRREYSPHRRTFRPVAFSSA